MEGDRKTPEGNFTVVNKRVHEKWDRFIMLDYPTKESYDKFNYRKAHGIIPKSAQIGGGIGIHGVWPHEEFAVDRYDNWTQGCISMKNEDVEELYSMVKPGTKVIIKNDVTSFIDLRCGVMFFVQECDARGDAICTKARPRKITKGFGRLFYFIFNDFAHGFSYTLLSTHEITST